MPKPDRVIPEGFHTITPSLVVRDPAAALTFYARAFGATEVMCLRGGDGAILHAELKIGDSIFMLGGEWPEYATKAPDAAVQSFGLHVYVANVDQAFERAVAAGCRALMPPMDMFWGDRLCKLVDPFGHYWGLAQFIEEVSLEEHTRRAAAWKPA